MARVVHANKSKNRCFLVGVVLENRALIENPNRNRTVVSQIAWTGSSSKRATKEVFGSLGVYRISVGLTGWGFAVLSRFHNGVCRL